MCVLQCYLSRRQSASYANKIPVKWKVLWYRKSFVCSNILLKKLDCFFFFCSTNDIRQAREKLKCLCLRRSAARIKIDRRFSGWIERCMWEKQGREQRVYGLCVKKGFFLLLSRRAGEQRWPWTTQRWAPPAFCIWAMWCRCMQKAACAASSAHWGKWSEFIIYICRLAAEIQQQINNREHMWHSTYQCHYPFTNFQCLSVYLFFSKRTKRTTTKKTIINGSLWLRLMDGCCLDSHNRLAQRTRTHE